MTHPTGGPDTATTDGPPPGSRPGSPVRAVASRWVPVATLVAVSVLVLYRTGPGKVPGPEGFEMVARNWPHTPLIPEAAYLLRQGLGQALYHLTGWQGTRPFLLLHVLALSVSGLALTAWLMRRLGLQRGTIAACLLALSPVPAVLLEWIGLYDSFSVLVWVLMILALRGRPWLQLAVGFLGGLQNFEQFVASVVVLALLPEVGRPFGLRARPVALVAGAVAGKVVLEAYLRMEGASSGSRAAFLSNPDLLHFVLTTFAALAPILVYTALGPLWVPVLRHLPAAWADAPRSLRVRGVLAALVLLGLCVISADHTRVLVLVSFPLVVVLAMRLAAPYASVRQWLGTWEAWAVLVIPPFVIVSGGSPLPLGVDLATWGL